MTASRREFLQGALSISAAALARGGIPEVIRRAMAIDPETGTTFMDAEHIVVLMQENRSFDHCFGALQGVRGFRDPCAHVQPDGKPVWFQSDAQGAVHAPFRLDIAGSNATWLGGLPHSWPDQVDARNGGRYDQWLIAKPKQHLPFTLGHYQREDLPFYYALADAFTVCDQAFCSSLTGTTANRLFLWTGNIRAGAEDSARVQNDDTRYEREASWTTFPERLEDAGVSWRIYQNEISLDSGLEGEADAWLTNFTDNPIEWFSQYHVRFARNHREYLPVLIAGLPARIAEAEQAAAESVLSAAEATKRQRLVVSLKSQLETAKAEVVKYTDAAWEALPARERALHEKAFANNAGDPQYRELAAHRYLDGTVAREVQLPAGDTLHRFRQDVASGQLPAISWLVAPENFSDHPSAPWYGAWYVSEVLGILTHDPEVWKKTIFVLCYDENDGYFDHVPPFVSPHPERIATGKVSDGIDTSVDWANVHGRDHAIGLGYRVPMVVASPWSRGGCVNSQVFDHTSVLQLMEHWLAGKGKAVRESNISAWRRTVCGDLTSVFRPYHGDPLTFPASLQLDATVERIHAAQFKPASQAPTSLASLEEIAALQEPGTRTSCPLAYELAVGAERSLGTLVVTMEARNHQFGKRALGAAFRVASYGETFESRAYAVKAGDSVSDKWPAKSGCHVRVDGPNGFLREFIEPVEPIDLAVSVETNPRKFEFAIRAANSGTAIRHVKVNWGSSNSMTVTLPVRPGGYSTMRLSTKENGGWYAVTVECDGLRYRYAGRIETGEWGITDPYMGGVAR